MSGLGSWLGLGLGSVLGLVLGLIILGTLSRYYCAHSITPCFNRSVGTITTAYLLVNKFHDFGILKLRTTEPFRSDSRTFFSNLRTFGLKNLRTHEPSNLRIFGLMGCNRNKQLICRLVHDWMTALDNKTQTDAILLDFAKAFDKVPHKRLLSKLSSYGITSNTHNWITSFLSNRKQRVSVNGALSDITDVTSGVPQGSVLGPILFLLYINDINENIQSSIRLFADDSIIYRKINSNIDHQILQTDLIQLEKWSDKWQMQFNI